MPFRDVAGHRRVIDLLAGAVGRHTLPPALLFSGPDGVGKRLTAIALAQALNCQRPIAIDGRHGEQRSDERSAQPGTDSCGECPSCRRIARGTHPDVVVLEPEDGIIAIAAVREDVIGKSGYRPFEGRRRVFIIDDAELMNEPAQDALLKTLEEPPAFSVLVLVSAQPEALLPTVRSRCYRLRFGPVSEEDVARVLRERHGMAEADARAASALSDGSVGRALAIESGRLVEARDAATHILRAVSSGRLHHRLQGGKDFLSGPRAGVDRAVVSERLRALSSILRDLELMATRADAALVANADLKGELEAILPAFDTSRVLRAFAAVDRASAALERNASPKIVADWLASEL